MLAILLPVSIFLFIAAFIKENGWWVFLNAIAGLCLLYLIWEGINKIGNKL